MRRQGDDGMGRVTVQVNLANQEDLVLAKAGTLAPDKVRRLQVPGVVDTGASYLVLPKKVATQLGVPSAGKATVRYADRRKATRPIVKSVEVELLGRQGTFKAIVEPNRTDVLIGAIVLEDLDLLVDCQAQTLYPRDPNRIITEIE
jgi:clan AA aspartic protease